jgi:hypothetical protein
MYFLEEEMTDERTEDRKFSKIKFKKQNNFSIPSFTTGKGLKEV